MLDRLTLIYRSPFAPKMVRVRVNIPVLLVLLLTAPKVRFAVLTINSVFILWGIEFSMSTMAVSMVGLRANVRVSRRK